MSIRRQLLDLLADGALHSGEVLGDRLGVSRMAVCKHVRALRDGGVPIETVKGRGYRLPYAVELLDGDAILAALHPATRTRLNGIETLLEVDSTNSRLRRLASEGAASGTACLAEQQRAGRGRNNRRWISPFAANLYVSLLWRTPAGVAGLGGLSLVAGIAVVRGLESFGVTTAGLKWPNDVIVDGAKLAGILIDVTGESTGPCAAIIGIGINVAMPRRDAEQIDQRWTDLCSVTGREAVSRNRLAARLLDALLEAVAIFDLQGLEPFLPEWRRLDIAAGRQVDLRIGSEVVPGRARGIDAAGALLVDTDSGRRRFASGEISLRLAP
jgi:BirA family biotin operon repressor/biotin-[acetyl-CoA-carboxylase] ligase